MKVHAIAEGTIDQVSANERVVEVYLGASTMLNVDAVNLHYGAAQALRGVSLTAEVGKVTCVLGRNGVGKSSLLRAIVGQKPISGGTITFDGDPISASSHRSIARGAASPMCRRGVKSFRSSPSPRISRLVLRRSNATTAAFRTMCSLCSRAQDDARSAGRRSIRRSATTARHRPRAGHAAKASFARRAHRRYSAVDHQGHRTGDHLSPRVSEMAIVLVEQYLDFAKELRHAGRHGPWIYRLFRQQGGTGRSGAGAGHGDLAKRKILIYLLNWRGVVAGA